MLNDKPPQKNHIHQQEDNMAWMVRHCSPLLYIHTAAYARWSGNQSDLASQRNRCASMDLSGVRFQVHYR